MRNGRHSWPRHSARADWYREGTKRLLASNWAAKGAEVPEKMFATCFALLFLKRQTAPLAAGKKDRPARRADNGTVIGRALALFALCTGCARERDTEGLVATPTGSVFVRSRGSGPHLVLLHGLGDSGVGWRKIESGLLEAGFRVTVWDALGAGRSEKPAEPDYRLVAHVERLRAVLDEIGAPRVTLVAHSLGGTIALLYALDHPVRVERLVLISPAAYAEGGWTGDWIWQVPLTATLEKVPAQAIADLALRMNFGDAARITAEDRAVYAAEAARPGTIGAFVLQQQQVMPDPEQVRRWIARYGELRMPALILWGTRDRVLDPALGARLAKALPQARLVPLEGIGHAAQLEAPAAVLAEVLAFLRS